MSLATLCLEPITAGMGIPAGYDDWRFVVQVATVSTGKFLGSMVLGDPLAGYAWRDVTADAHQVLIDRGAEAGERPGAGEISFWLCNDTGDYSPAASPNHDAGTLVRVSLGPPATVCPLATGVTISWNERGEGFGAVRTIEITALETISALGDVDEPATAAAGAGENLAARVARILDAAAWRFGKDDAFWSGGVPWTYTYQATTLAQVAWAELLLTCDSAAMTVMSGKDGRIKIFERGDGYLGTGLNVLGSEVDVVADSIITTRDDERILWRVDLARAGGSAVTYLKNGIRGRYGKKSTQRYDLNTIDPGGDADLARFAADVLDRGSQTYRVESVELFAERLGPASVWEFLGGVDVGTTVDVDRPDTVVGAGGVIFNRYIVCGYTLLVEPLDGESVTVAATLETDTSSTSSWETY